MLDSDVEEERAGSSKDRSFRHVAIETGSSRVQGTPSSKVVAVHFDKPWQQLSIAFSTLGFLGLTFVGLWQAIPAINSPDTSEAVSLENATAERMATASIGISGGKPKIPPITKMISAESRRPNRLRGQLSVDNSSTASAPHGRSVQSSQKSATSILRISVAHHFATANLAIWVDDQLTFQYSLQGALKKHIIVLRDLQGYFSDTVPIPAGEHRIRVRVLSQDGAYDESESTSGSFDPGGEKILRIDFAKNNRGMRLSLQAEESH